MGGVVASPGGWHRLHRQFSKHVRLRAGSSDRCIARVLLAFQRLLEHAGRGRCHPVCRGHRPRGSQGGGLLALEIPPGATEPYLGLGGILHVTETLMPDGEWHGVASSPGKGLDPHPAKLLLDSGLKTRRPGSLWPPCLARHRKEVRQRGASSRRSGACQLARPRSPGGVSKEHSRRFLSRGASGIPHPSQDGGPE